MALTVTKVAGDPKGATGTHLVLKIAKIDFDTSLAAGGEAVLASDFGLTTLYGMVECGADTLAGYLYRMDVDGLKLSAAYRPTIDDGGEGAQALGEAATVDVGTAYFLVIGV